MHTLSLLKLTFFLTEPCIGKCKTPETPEGCDKCAKDDDCCSRKCNIESGYCIDKGIKVFFTLK